MYVCICHHPATPKKRATTCTQTYLFGRRWTHPNSKAPYCKLSISRSSIHIHTYTHTPTKYFLAEPFIYLKRFISAVWCDMVRRKVEEDICEREKKNTITAGVVWRIRDCFALFSFNQHSQVNCLTICVLYLLHFFPYVIQSVFDWFRIFFFCFSYYLYWKDKWSITCVCLCVN